MKVFKFGGASVKDAEGVKNLVNVLTHEGIKNTLIVISAMGKMTNAFENIVNSYFHKTKDLSANIAYVKEYHLEIARELFNDTDHSIYSEIDAIVNTLHLFLAKNNSTDYNFIYDQIVGFGEMLSTKIISRYLNHSGIKNKWIDVRKYIITNANFRDASVNWKQTTTNISTLNTYKQLYITQGFLGATLKGETTTLGREGSDFTAAIFAYCLNAKSLTIWKDVNGVLNADPRYFKNATPLPKISYKEAIEMAFYGASVIHPKTLKPLENKRIPLYVRSFYDLNLSGTEVNKDLKGTVETPCFIVKHHQKLVAISALDFSFMVESNLSDIFKVLHTHKIKVNLIQNSAISFSVCIEDKYNNFKLFLTELKDKYNVNYVEDVTLYTVRHATPKSIKEIESKGTVLLKQVTMGTVQVVVE